MMSHNSVDSTTFNSTCKGYVKRALNECKTLTEDQKKEVLKKLYYAMDVMTMQDARELEEKD